jgi:hypothetical protein
MKCTNYQSWIQSQLDGEQQGDPADFESHLRACPDCLALDRATQRLRDGLLALTPPCPPPGLADRIAGRVIAERLRARRRRVVAWAAVAAGLLVAVGLGLGWSRLFPPKPAHPAVSEGVVAHKEEPALPPVHLRKSLAEAGSAVASLTGRAADETVGHTRLLIPSMPRPEPGAAVALDKPARSLREAGQGVSEGFEPVTDSARRAVGLFFRELPMSQDKRPQF